MRFIDVELNGTVVRAALNDDLAPKTCQAIWDALPFEGRAVHAQVSGDMFRMLDYAPIGDLAVESGVSFQHPGQIIYFPGIKEIAFCLVAEIMDEEQSGFNVALVALPIDREANRMRCHPRHRFPPSRSRKESGFSPSTSWASAFLRKALQSPSKRASGVIEAALHGPLMQPLSP